MTVFSINASPRSVLSPVQALELANIYLANAHSTKDPSIAMALCYDTKVALSQAKKTAKRAEDRSVRDSVAITYIELGKLLDVHGKDDDAQASYKKADGLGLVRDAQVLVYHSRCTNQQEKVCERPPNSSKNSTTNRVTGAIYRRLRADSCRTWILITALQPKAR
jgi:hypothetical protein